MEIYYLHNSGFACVTDGSLLVFDYFKNVTESAHKDRTGGVIGSQDLLLRKKVYVFSSHSHPDHFNPVILNWQDINRNTVYFLDRGIAGTVHRKKASNAYFIGKGDEAGDGNVFVRAYGSTDTGSSFYVETEGIRIFHAGDLNLWHWQEESTAAEIEEARKAFYFEMAEIEKTMPRPDYAFFPVDAIMGKDYDEGAQYFIRAVKPRVFIPMHCRTGFSHLEDFKNRTQNEETQVLTYSQRGEKLL